MYLLGVHFFTRNPFLAVSLLVFSQQLIVLAFFYRCIYSITVDYRAIIPAEYDGIAAVV